MNHLSETFFDSGSLVSLKKIQQKVGRWIYPILWKGYLDFATRTIADYRTFFVQVSLRYWVFLFHPETSPAVIRERIRNDIAATKFLQQKITEWYLHSIVEPVEILTCGLTAAPYMCKSIPGKAWFPFSEEDTHARNIFRLFESFITDNLYDLGIYPFETFDINDSNIILNDMFIRLIEDSRDCADRIQDMVRRSKYDEKKTFFDEWIQKWAKVYLFDFGTWILPE